MTLFLSRTILSYGLMVGQLGGVGAIEKGERQIIVVKEVGYRVSLAGKNDRIPVLDEEAYENFCN